MAINKSIIEDFELSSGTQVYVQSSGHSKGIVLSFDSTEGGFNIRMTPNEAEKLQHLIGIVVKETSS